MKSSPSTTAPSDKTSSFSVKKRDKTHTKSSSSSRPVMDPDRRERINSLFPFYKKEKERQELIQRAHQEKTREKETKSSSEFQTNSIRWEHPPVSQENLVSVPVGKGLQGAFGSKRTQEYYFTGVDVECKPIISSDRKNKPILVRAVEDGTVVNVAFINDKHKQEDHRMFIMVEGLSGVVIYCNILNCSQDEDEFNSEIPTVGTFIEAGEIIGKVSHVQHWDKKRKKMRHNRNKFKLKIELYKKGTKKRATWMIDSHKRKPKHLMDPTSLLLNIYSVFKK